MFRSRYLVFLATLLVLLFVASCRPDSPEPVEEPGAATATSAPAPVQDSDPVEAATSEPAPTVEPSPSGPAPISQLQDVQSGIVQIVAEGSFRDPQVGQMLNVAGSGSGFIIDPSGVAVTNNHVVTGAALLRVYVGGEDTPRNARVLGVSECSDLAVIDIEGEGYPYFEWYNGDINVGLDVYAAGFPLGDPEFTLTRGIVSKAKAGGETSWASVDEVLEHDATINPGNSGGPLVTADGKIVGVNYAGRSDTNQYFAIAQSEALPVIQQLQAGSDVTSLGINGTAIADPESGLYGIWVSSVESGSPADQAGIEAGDIVTTLEGLVLSTDGTMADYCDILRSRNSSDVMSVEVLRFDTQQVLEGRLNSGSQLVVSTDFSQQLGDEVADSNNASGGGTAAGYDSYVSVTDDSGTLEVQVPAAWSDISGEAWTNDAGETLGPAVSASPDLEAYRNTWGMPGMEFVSVSDLGTEVTVGEVLDLFEYSESCSYGGRESYSDSLYTGEYDIWEDCGDEGSLYLVLVTVPEDRSFHNVVFVQVVSDADLEALDYILNSFIVQR